MNLPIIVDLRIPQGKNWSKVLRWGSGAFTFKPFDNAGAIVQLAPLQIKVTGHGLTDGWPFLLASVSGMLELNERDFVAKKIDANIFEVQELVDAETGATRPVNAAGYAAYVSGGYLEYETPESLAGKTMRWQGRKSYDAADPAEFDYSTTLSGNGSGIVLDDTNKTVTLQVDDADSAGWTFDVLLHEIEVTVTAGGSKPPFAQGTLTVLREVVK